MEKNYDITIEAVLERELYTSPPLMPVIAAKLIGTKQDIPRAFRLTRDVSAGDLKHLRRIKDLPDSRIECIIGRCQSDPFSWKDDLTKLKERYSKDNIFEDYRIAHVPSKAPKTNHQWKNCMKIWPCKFAKCNYLIRSMDGSLFNNTELIVLKIIVNNILNYIAKTPVDNNHCQSAAIVFRCAKIYGIGLSDSKLLNANPTKHSTMMAIDSVAKNAGSGHWQSDTGDEIRINIQKQLDDHEDLREHRIDAHFLPYLCTNYDIFVTEEPCLMCTMGLVQSRIRRLFYIDSESLDKLTKCKQLCYRDRAIEKRLVHRDKNLNHRFEAWKITLSEST